MQGQRQYSGSCNRSHSAKAESTGCRGGIWTGFDRNTFNVTHCGWNRRDGTQFDCEDNSERGFFARALADARTTEDNGVIRDGRGAQAQLRG